MEILRVKDLQKTFRDKRGRIEAVKNVSFSVQKGEMVGLLGPNGAGKTTTIKCILDLVKPDAGEIWVNGIDRMKNSGEARKYMAAVLEGARNTYWRLTVWENIVFFAGIHGVSLSKGREYFEYLLEILGLKDKRNTEVRNLSSGYKQKTAVACTLAKQTPLVFLDEPTLGLDVEASYELREALKNLQANEKRTIVVSSHDMHVIQDVCSRVVIISNGRILVDQKVPELLSIFSTRKYRVVIANGTDALRTGRVLAEVSRVFPDAVTRVSPEMAEISVVLTDSSQIYELVDVLKAQGVTIETITQEEVDLEKAFLEIVRRDNGSCD